MSRISNESELVAGADNVAISAVRMGQLLTDLKQIRAEVADCIAAPSEYKEALICKQVREISLPLCELSLSRVVDVLNSSAQCGVGRGITISTLHLQAYAEIVDDVICYVESLRDGYHDDDSFLENIEAKMSRVGVNSEESVKSCLSGCPSGVMNDFLADAGRSVRAIRSQLNDWQQTPKSNDQAKSFMRLLHTMKGCALVYGASDLIEIIQRLESTTAAFLKGELKACDNLFELLARNVSRLSVMVDLMMREHLAPDGGDVATPLAPLGELSPSLAPERRFDARDDGAARTSMEPFTVKLARLHFLVERASVMLDKPVQLVVQGGGLALPVTITEKIVSPLELLLWNAIDHGIEAREGRSAAGKPHTGEVRLSLSRSDDGKRVVISVGDDGDGIDLKAVHEKALAAGISSTPSAKGNPAEMVFQPGLSTARVLSPVSGRGVGLDVVKREIEGIGGTVSAESHRGKGTCFTLSIPLGS